MIDITLIFMTALRKSNTFFIWMLSSFNVLFSTQIISIGGIDLLYLKSTSKAYKIELKILVDVQTSLNKHIKCIQIFPGSLYQRVVFLITFFKPIASYNCCSFTLYYQFWHWDRPKLLFRHVLLYSSGCFECQSKNFQFPFYVSAVGAKTTKLILGCGVSSRIIRTLSEIGKKSITDLLIFCLLKMPGHIHVVSSWIPG